MLEAVRTSQALAFHLLRDNLGGLVVSANSLLSHCALLVLKLRCRSEHQCLKMPVRLRRKKNVVMVTARLAPHNPTALLALVERSFALAVLLFTHVCVGDRNPSIVRNRRQVVNETAWTGKFGHSVAIGLASHSYHLTHSMKQDHTQFAAKARFGERFTTAAVLDKPSDEASLSAMRGQYQASPASAISSPPLLRDRTRFVDVIYAAHVAYSSSRDETADNVRFKNVRFEISRFPCRSPNAPATGVFPRPFCLHRRKFRT